MLSAVGPGPRLTMIMGDIDPSVRPALSVLTTSGAEMHLMNLRQMSDGCLFLDVSAVGLHLYGCALQPLASATAVPETAVVTGQPAPSEESAFVESAILAPAKEDAEALDEEDSETPTTLPTPRVTPHLREVFIYLIDKEPPAPWKPTAEEPSTEDFSSEQPASETAEHTERTVHGSDSEDAETEPADELLGHENNVTEARGHEATEENVGDVADESTVDVHDGADVSVDESHSEEAPGQVDAQQADNAYTGDAQRTGERQTPEGEESRWEHPAHMSRRAIRRAHEESSELNDDGAADTAMASSVDRSEESPRAAQARAEGLPVLGRGETGLRTLAEILGQDTSLVTHSGLGLPADLVLAASGTIPGAGLIYLLLDTPFTARGLDHIDAWGQVHIGGRLGPILAEVLDEINREVVHEYTQAPRGQHSVKH